jgi:hypothetical protein
MNWNLNEFRNPVTLVSLGIAVISLAVTVFTYLWARHEAHISYHATTLQIVNQKEAVPFSVIDSTGERVMENVYATNVTVWNSGDLPIDPPNVRSPLVIYLTPPGIRIIDVILENVTRENISGFRIDGDPKQSGGVQISWRYFDPKDGFRLRLIYASADVRKVNLNGAILGISEFDDITPPPKSEISWRVPGLPQMALSACC